MNKLTSVEHDRTEKMEWLKKIIHSQLCYGLDTVKFAVRAESKQNWSTAKRTVYAANGEWNMNSSRICKQVQRIVPHEQMRTMSLKPLMRPTNQPLCILFHQINTIAIHIQYTRILPIHCWCIRLLLSIYRIAFVHRKYTLLSYLWCW